MSDNIALALSTRVKPAKKFTVDGEEFQLLGLDHLSESDEAEAMALFSRHALLVAESESTANVLKGKEIADRVRKTRIQIICKLTDLPRSVAEKLPLSGQAALLETLRDELNTKEEDSGGDDDDTDADASGDRD